MPLINIAYGSLASSETMNKNFNYLDEKIENESNATMTSISSILSNVATINTRLAELSESISNIGIDFNAKLDECKNKTKILVQQSTMLPHWNGCRSISISDVYSVTANGFVLILPEENSVGSLKVNTTNITDLRQDFIFIPVKEGDVIISSLAIKKAFFLPVTEVSIDNF